GEHGNARPADVVELAPCLTEIGAGQREDEQRAARDQEEDRRVPHADRATRGAPTPCGRRESRRPCRCRRRGAGGGGKKRRRPGRARIRGDGSGPGRWRRGTTPTEPWGGLGGGGGGDGRWTGGGPGR